jgi:hypothetical protein
MRKLLVIFMLYASILHGQVTMQKQLFGTQAETGSAICNLPGGGFVVSGTTTSFGAGMKDIFITRFDSSGTQVWSRVIGTPNDDTCYSITTTLDGNLVLTGLTWGGTLGNSDALLAKISGSGQLLWTKVFGTSVRDAGIKVVATPDSGFIAGGFVQYPVTFNPVMGSPTNAYIKRYDKQGNELWTQYFASLSCHNFMGELVSASNGDIFIFLGRQCQVNPPNYVNDNLIARISATGQLLWQKTFNAFSPYSVIPTSDNGVFMTNSGTGADFYAAKIDSAGNFVFGKTYGFFSLITATAITDVSGNGYLVTGSILPTVLDTLGTFFIRMNENGMPVWAKYHNISAQYALSYVHTTALTDGRLAMVNDGQELHIAITDSNAMPLCQNARTLTVYVNTFNISLTSENQVNVAPTVLTASPVISFSAAAFSESNSCQPSSTIGIAEQETPFTFSVSPNPSDGLFTFKTTASGSKAISVLNMLGETVFTSNTVAQQLELDLRGEARGVYFVHMTNERGDRTTAKVVVR